LGIQQEFFESVMIARLPVEGFLGFEPQPDGLSLRPRLPADWPELTIGPLRWRGLSVTARATQTLAELILHGHSDEIWTLRVDARYDRAVAQDAAGAWIPLAGTQEGGDLVYRVPSAGLQRLRFERTGG